MPSLCLMLLRRAASHCVNVYRKGISRSAKPYRRSAPSWLKATAPTVIDQITKMAKKGMTPSQIGVMLRDSHGIAQVKAVTGSKILRILKSQGKFLPALSCCQCLVKCVAGIQNS